MFPSSAEDAAARRLFQTLFPPTARQQLLRADRILLSPDGVLWDVPFAALVVNDRGTPKYLGLEKPLTYTQSLAVFNASQSRDALIHATSSAGALIVGNPTYAAPPSNGDRASSAARSGSVGELALLSHDGEAPAQLPNAEVEARRVAELYHTSAAIGPVPTERWVRERVSQASIIHLATHGYFNPRRAMGSGLLLAAPRSAPANGETDSDGALQAWEIFSQFRLRAEVVVLSACQTGEGLKVPGEGLVGLTRAFQVAGAASVVATQWSVADRSTETAMVAFHERLRRGRTQGCRTARRDAEACR